MTAADFLRKRATDLKVWKRGGERAVHKPLLTLLLIARAARGTENNLRFEEVHGFLADLLRDFGPPRKSVHPEYPFWHLRSDDFWVVRDAEAYPLKRGGSSPAKSALLEGGAAGFVKEPLWEALTEDADLRRDVTQGLLSQFWPQSLHAPLLDALGLELEREQAARAGRDPAFRRDLLTAYERRCAICGFDARLSGDDLGLEAAHIRWHCYEGPDVVRNGVLLCSLHHVVFDRGGLGVREDLRIQVSKHLCGGQVTEDWMGRFHGQPLLGPRDLEDRPAEKFLAWHAREVFRNPPRADAAVAGGER